MTEKEKQGPIEGGELMKLVPHKGKMFLLSRLVSWDVEKRRLSSEYDLGRGCIFYDPVLDSIPSWVSLECMSQSISALSALAGSIEPTPNFILTISHLEIKTPALKTGEKLRVKILEEGRLGSVLTYDCTAALSSGPIARAKLTVMKTEGPSLEKILTEKETD